MRIHRGFRPAGALTGAAAALLLAGAGARATDWQQGVHYFLIEPAQPTSLPAGKVEVTEVFSYACPACNAFYPAIDRLRDGLPPNAQLDFVPAGFNPSEDWPMFQRAYLAAQILGIDRKTHDAMFDAVWKTGELAVVDPHTNRLKVPAPSIQDAAAFYARTAGVKPEAFLAAASSFGVDSRIRQSDQLIRDYRVDSTPTMIINGKYRLTPQSAGGPDQVIELVKWLVARESPPSSKGEPVGAGKRASH
jgi:thiol:disulfide interchange protein DsbA